MKPICALCGRSMNEAAVLIGNMPVGPTCARRAGLMQLAKRRTGLVSPVLRSGKKSAPAPQTMDLFWADEVPA